MVNWPAINDELAADCEPDSQEAGVTGQNTAQNNLQYFNQKRNFNLEWNSLVSMFVMADEKLQQQ